jgi:hypothetical protein
MGKDAPDYSTMILMEIIHPAEAATSVRLRYIIYEPFYVRMHVFIHI